MRIPKSYAEAITRPVFTVMVFCFTLGGVINLFRGDAIIASSLWLAAVAFGYWIQCKDKGIRSYLIDYLGDVAGRYFVESRPEGVRPAEILFGFEFLGRRFIQRRVAQDKIDSVEWKTGQRTDMAGHDMNDWAVVLRFDHDAPDKKKFRDLHIIGPARRKKKTEALGLAFVDFLRNAGVPLERCGEDGRFVRSKS
jgi:hypothetical protein